MSASASSGHRRTGKIVALAGRLLVRRRRQGQPRRRRAERADAPPRGHRRHDPMDGSHRSDNRAAECTNRFGRRLLPTGGDRDRQNRGQRYNFRSRRLRHPRPGTAVRQAARATRRRRPRDSGGRREDQEQAGFLLRRRHLNAVTRHGGIAANIAELAGRMAVCNEPNAASRPRP